MEYRKCQACNQPDISPNTASIVVLHTVRGMYVCTYIQCLCPWPVPQPPTPAYPSLLNPEPGEQRYVSAFRTIALNCHSSWCCSAVSPAIVNRYCGLGS